MNRLLLSVVPAARPTDGDRAVRELAAAADVLLLCTGNICRSPMAERYLRSLVDEHDLQVRSVESAGFVDVENRPSPETAVAVGREYGVDLSAHESTTVTAEMLARSDVVFVMDGYNYATLKRRFDEGVDRTYFLRAVPPDDEFEISDPHGADAETFRRVYGEIADSLDRAVSKLQGTDS